MQRESSLFIAATTNHARTTSVSIDDGGVYAIGYRYDTTVVGNQESINTIDRHRHTDTWIVYHRPNGEVLLIDRLLDNAHDIVGNGIVALSDGDTWPLQTASTPFIPKPISQASRARKCRGKGSFSPTQTRSPSSHEYAAWAATIWWSAVIPRPMASP